VPSYTHTNVLIFIFFIFQFHQGSSAGTQHSFSEEERDAFVDHINQCLKGRTELASKLPLGKEMQLFEAVKDGTLLIALINDAVPNTIDERVVNWKPKNAFEVTENQNVVVNSCKAIGVSVVNVGHTDLTEGKVHIVLGLVWQIVKIGLLSKISLNSCPELFRLLEDGETLDDLMKLTPEQLLLRWFNYHLKKAGHPKQVKNFGGDIKDSEAYTVLLHQLKPAECDLKPLAQTDSTARAEAMLANADKIGCRKYVSPKDVVKGNTKLNLAFVANLFNTWPCLEPLTEEEKAALDDWLFNSEGTREARAFCLWINSLGVQTELVNNLFNDLRDGLVILRVMDVVSPGVVQWAKVNQNPEKMNAFKRVENCNYAVVLGKGPAFKFSLVGVGGKDLADGNKTLTLALVWQLMRQHILTVLAKLSEGGKQINDQDIVAWANNTVAAGGKKTTMASFKDPSLSNSHFFLDLINSIRNIVNYDLVDLTPTADEKAKIQNARYVISLARKIGATIFLLPEDIVEVKPKMLMTLTGAIWVGQKGASH
jgi:plastin-1